MAPVGLSSGTCSTGHTSKFIDVDGMDYNPVLALSIFIQYDAISISFCGTANLVLGTVSRDQLLVHKV